MESDDTMAAGGGEPAGLVPGARAGGRYLIKRLIGTGGMGEVFEAEDLIIGSRVALKALRADRVVPTSIARMRREIALARKITHPNVCRIHDLGEHEGRVFLTMELIAGDNLSDRIQKGPLVISEARAIADQLIAGLAAAHAVGIVHRDFKSANIVLAGSRAVITDFGLARSEAGDHSDLTGDGAMLGTAAYMAPEQVEGRPATPASDIYALGVVLFEMVTGKQPFRGDTPLQTASARLVSDAPSAHGLRPDLPAAWGTTIARCLARDPDKRFATAEEVGSALAGARTITKPRTRYGFAIAGLALLGVGTGGGFVMRGGSKSVLVPNAAPPIAPPTFVPVTYRRGAVRAARFAPDGKKVLYSAAWDGLPESTFEATPGQPEVRVLFADAGLLAVARDGRIALRLGGVPSRALYYPVTYGTLAVASLSGNAPRPIADDVISADWAPGSDRPVMLRDVPAGTLLDASGRDGITTPEIAWSVRVSPDGSQLAYAAANNGRVSVSIVDPTGKRKFLLREWRDVSGLAWSPDGREIWFTGSRSVLAAANALHAVDREGRIREIYRVPGSLTLHDLADGKVLLSRDTVTRDAGIHRDGVAVDGSLSWFDDTLPVGISDAGTKIAFGEGGLAAFDSLFGSAFVRELDGSPAIYLGDHGVSALSPDGALAVGWDRAHPEPPERLVLIPTGAGTTRPLDRGKLVVFNTMAFSHDGRYLVLGAREQRDDKNSIYLQPLDGTPRLIVDNANFMDATQPLSFDGRWVAGTRDRGVQLFPVAGGEPHEVAGTKPGDIVSRWSPDGKLYIQRGGAGGTSVYLVDFAGDVWKPLYTIAPPDPTGVELYPRAVLTPDGKTCVYSYRRRLSQLYVVEGLR